MSASGICPVCYGTGWIDQGGDDISQCPRCGGSGIVHVDGADE